MEDYQKLSLTPRKPHRQVLHINTTHCAIDEGKIHYIEPYLCHYKLSLLAALTEDPDCSDESILVFIAYGPEIVVNRIRGDNDEMVQVTTLTVDIDGIQEINYVTAGVLDGVRVLVATYDAGYIGVFFADDLERVPIMIRHDDAPWSIGLCQKVSGFYIGANSHDVRMYTLDASGLKDRRILYKHGHNVPAVSVCPENDDIYATACVDCIVRIIEHNKVLAQADLEYIIWDVTWVRKSDIFPVIGHKSQVPQKFKKNSDMKKPMNNTEISHGAPKKIWAEVEKDYLLVVSTMSAIYLLDSNLRVVASPLSWDSNLPIPVTQIRRVQFNYFIPELSVLISACIFSKTIYFHKIVLDITSGTYKFVLDHAICVPDYIHGMDLVDCFKELKKGELNVEKYKLVVSCYKTVQTFNIYPDQ